MKIALIGYGKMGKAVEKIALKRGHTIVARIDPEISSNSSAVQLLIKEADVCIDFSHKDAVLDHLKLCTDLKKPLVIGTTGWDEYLDKARHMVHEAKIGVIYSPNFSIGVNLFFKIVKEAAKLFNPFDIYDVAGLELHHNNKHDSPSGTAIALADILIKEIDRKRRPLFDSPNRKIDPHELQFTSLRLGSIPGTHQVIFDSSHDTITLSHEARSRDGFAEGAVIAGEWLKDKAGFYTLEDLL